MILAQRELLTLAKSEVTVGRLEIERLKLMLAKARREQFGQSSERGRLLVEHMMHDKKMDAGTLPFVLLRGIGEAFLARDVDLADITAFLDEELAR